MLMIVIAIVAIVLGLDRRQSRTIYPPDLIVVDVPRALPGRPIEGVRLVRPDGTITLGYYGEISITGLTPEDAKAKVATHLRRYLSDEDLGLVEFTEGLDGTRAIRRMSAYHTKRVSVRIDRKNMQSGFLELAARYMRRKLGLPYRSALWFD
jgi:hypothetical protein